MVRAVNARRLLTALGSAATTFLLVGAAVIEAVAAATGADVGPGIVGVGVGALAAIAALVLVAWRLEGTGPVGRALLAGYAAFGLVFLGLSMSSYVNVPGARATLSVPLNAGIAAAVAVGVALVLRWVDHGGSDRRRSA